MENIKIKFKNSGIILIAPTYIDDNGVKRFKESFKPYPWIDKDRNEEKLKWLQKEISDEELVISHIVSGVSVSYIEECFSWEGNLDIIEIIEDNKGE